MTIDMLACLNLITGSACFLTGSAGFIKLLQPIGAILEY